MANWTWIQFIQTSSPERNRNSWTVLSLQRWPWGMARLPHPLNSSKRRIRLMLLGSEGVVFESLLINAPGRASTPDPPLSTAWTNVWTPDHGTQTHTQCHVECWIRPLSIPPITNPCFESTWLSSWSLGFQISDDFGPLDNIYLAECQLYWWLYSDYYGIENKNAQD